MPRRGHKETPTEAAGMDLDGDLQGQSTPLDTPFEDDFTETASRCAPTVDPPAGVHTENFYTPLYAESQSTCHLDRTATYITQIRDTQPVAGVAATLAEAETEEAAIKA